MVSAAQRDAITNQFKGIVLPIAERLKSNLPPSIELNDLVQIGLFTLWEAAEKYQASRAVTFGYYARLRVRGAMIDSIKGRAYRDATHEPLPVIPIADLRRNIEQERIERDETRMVASAREREYKRVQAAIADTDPKFHPLSRRQKKILQLRYERGMTQKAAGQVMQINQSGARELELRALRNLRRKLAA
jgi:RNA polymerase sigma factor (sigma-70 family)